MKRDERLTPLRFENMAQEKRNERDAESKNTERLLKILAKKLGPSNASAAKIA
jgi:hypothetical protein